MSLTQRRVHHFQIGLANEILKSLLCPQQQPLEIKCSVYLGEKGYLPLLERNWPTKEPYRAAADSKALLPTLLLAYANPACLILPYPGQGLETG